MNNAHLHLVVNHFPIIGIFFGIGVLVVGLIFHNKIIQNTAHCLFIVAALFAVLSMATGDGAEEMVENIPNIGRKIIHNHEEMAEKLAFLLYLLGILSFVGLYANFKSLTQSKLISFVILTISFVAVFVAVETGTSGGEIRHTEIRSGQH